jgi:hypothetical protein
MKTHQEMQSITMMENPLVALMTRDKDAGRKAWKVERVFIDDDEAEAFLEPQRHRYPEADKEVNWKLYGIPCAGTLAVIVKEARDAAELASQEPQPTDPEDERKLAEGYMKLHPDAEPPAILKGDADDKQPDPFERHAPAGDLGADRIAAAEDAPGFSADDRGNVVDFYTADGEPVGKIDREAEVNGVPDRKTFEAFHSAEVLEAWMRANGYGEELDEIAEGYPEHENDQKAAAEGADRANEDEAARD